MITRTHVKEEEKNQYQFCFCWMNGIYFIIHILYTLFFREREKNVPNFEVKLNNRIKNSTRGIYQSLASFLCTQSVCVVRYVFRCLYFVCTYLNTNAFTCFSHFSLKKKDECEKKSGTVKKIRLTGIRTTFYLRSHYNHILKWNHMRIYYVFVGEGDKKFANHVYDKNHYEY